MASVISSSFRKLGLMRLDRLEHLGTEHVHADEREIALRLLRFLDQPNDLAVVQLRDAEHLRIGHACQEDLRRRLLARSKSSTNWRDALVQQVVAQIHHERLVADERLG